MKQYANIYQNVEKFICNLRESIYFFPRVCSVAYNTA